MPVVSPVGLGGRVAFFYTTVVEVVAQRNNTEKRLALLSHIRDIILHRLSDHVLAAAVCPRGAAPIADRQEIIVRTLGFVERDVEMVVIAIEFELVGRRRVHGERRGRGGLGGLGCDVLGRGKF